MTKLQSFACRIRGESHETIVITRTRGKAKWAFHLSILDCCPDLPFTAIRARSLGAVVTPVAFRRTAEYRGVPFARVGMRVRVGDEWGILVGNNSSANFDVLFDEDSVYKGQTLNCHPNSKITYFADDGSEIRSYGT